MMKAPRSRSGDSKTWSRFGPMDFAALLPTAFLLFLGLGALLRHLPPAIPLSYVTCSLMSVGLYAHDKSRARRGGWRTPESRLHLLDVLGGWPGGLIAQRLFRHKTRKISFQVVFWLCVAGHVGVWGWVFLRVPPETDFFRFLRQVTRAARTAFEW